MQDYLGLYSCDDVVQRFTYSLVTKVTCSTAQQTDDSRKEGCSASSRKIFLPFLKGCGVQLKCEWGTGTFHHKEIVLWAWGSSLFYSFKVNELQAFTQYHFRLEKQKKKKQKKENLTKKKHQTKKKKPTTNKKGAKTPQMLVPCPADVAWTAPT